MHQALYRKYRPSTFSDVVGQEHITSVLSWEVANNKVNHAYVFCGSAGTGKTSCAKILAKAVNCENPVNGNPCNCCYSCKQIDAGASVEVAGVDEVLCITNPSVNIQKTNQIDSILFVGGVVHRDYF